MGTWTAAVYTAEQQQRLGVDEQGNSGSGGGKKTRKTEKGLTKAKATAEAATAVEHTTLVGDKSFAPEARIDGRFYVTTAIAYTNGAPHIGHAYEFLTTDVLARWHRVWGRDVFFLTGTDEHGQKIANTAEKLGLQPIDICDRYAAEFQALQQRMRCSNDDFIRTTQERHHACAQELWRRCHANGDIYLGNYKGWYLEREETFVSPKDAEEWEYKDPSTGLPLKEMEEPSYFFRLSKYRQPLLDLIAERPDFIEPAERRQEILAMLSEEQADLSVSRTSFSWGIPMPDGFDAAHVMYVWFDALSNYVSGVHGTDPAHPRAHFWPADVHIIGKDIIRFHCIYWPAILLSAGLPLHHRVFAHGFVAAGDGRKMSKSYGNVIDPHDMLNKYPADTFRFFLSTETAYGNDLKFSEASLVRANNGPLADTLGNLVHRATHLTSKYCGGAAPAPQAGTDVGRPFDIASLRAEADEAMRAMNLSVCVGIAMEAARNTNNWLQVIAPWKMKHDRSAERAEAVRVALEAVYVLAHLLAPFLPNACTEILSRLGTPARPLAALSTDYSSVAPGTAVRIGKPLFDKLQELDGEGAAAEPAASPAVPSGGGKAKGGGGKGGKGGKGGAPAEKQEPATCPFAQLDVRVGELVEVWEHPGSTKLYCEKIACGEAEPREVASALRHAFTLEQMRGKRVLVICNLKSAKMGDFVSNGMVLCAKRLVDGVEQVEFVAPPADAKPGDRVLPAVFEGTSVPVSANQVKKRKVWETVVETLRTDDAGVPTVHGQPLVVEGVPCITSSILDAPIN